VKLRIGCCFTTVVLTLSRPILVGDPSGSFVTLSISEECTCRGVLFKMSVEEVVSWIEVIIPSLYIIVIVAFAYIAIKYPRDDLEEKKAN